MEFTQFSFALFIAGGILAGMSLPVKVTEALLRLSEAERLELARFLIESIGMPETASPTMEEAVRRLEELVSGRVEALSEEEFRAELAR
jgi:putative addiction module component (TIGR02574 family)